MASLALIISLILLAVILIGPIAYAASLIKPLPTPLVITLGILAIATGIYWLTVPTPVQLLGLIPITLGILAIRRRTQQKRPTQP